MPNNNHRMLENNQAQMILQNMVEAGRIGLFSWDFENQHFDVMETFTGKSFNEV